MFTTDEGTKGRLSPEQMIRPDADWEIKYFRCSSNSLANRYGLHISKDMERAIGERLSDFDIVHTHEWRSIPNIYLWRNSRKFGVPYVIQAHGAAEPKVAARNTGHVLSQVLFDYSVGRRIANSASRVIAYHETEAAQYLSQGVSANRIVYMPNGIDLSEYGNLPERGCFRERTGISEDERIILYLGRLNRIKGIDILVSAFAKSECRSQSRLVIAGPDDGARSALETQILQLGLKDRIIFTGILTGKDKLQAYIDADVYVLPSRYEAFSLTIFEALACGIPVIVSDRCGASRIVREGNAGCIVQPNDVEMSMAIDRLIGDNHLRGVLGKNGQRLVRENYSWETVARKLEDVYSQVIRECANASR